jgi:hypothetical protein
MLEHLKQFCKKIQNSKVKLLLFWINEPFKTTAYKIYQQQSTGTEKPKDYD